MSVANGQIANASTFNNAFVSRTTDTDTTGKLDLKNAAAVSGGNILNTQKVINSIASALGMTTSQVYNFLMTWSSDIVGAPNDTVKARIEAIVAEFVGNTGHTHDGTDGDGAKISGLNIAWAQGNNSTNGNIDSLPLLYASTRLTGTSPVLRGITAGVAGQSFFIINASGGDLIVKNNDTNPAANDRILTGTGNDLTIQDGGLLLVHYDGTSNKWLVTGGAGGGGGVTGYGEDLGGTVDGVNTTFGPLSFAPIDTDSIEVYLDGLWISPTLWSKVGNNIVFSTAPVAPQVPSVWYLKSSVTTPGGGTAHRVPYGTATLPETVIAGTGVVWGAEARQVHWVKSVGGAVSVTANPQISAGTEVGQELLLKGGSDTDYIILSDGNGLDLNGSWNGTKNNALQLTWDGNEWSEDGRR